MAKTHLITIPKEQFNEIEIGDRLIIQNDEDKFCYVVCVENNDNEDNEMWDWYEGKDKLWADTEVMK